MPDVTLKHQETHAEVARIHYEDDKPVIKYTFDRVDDPKQKQRTTRNIPLSQVQELVYIKDRRFLSDVAISDVSRLFHGPSLRYLKEVQRQMTERALEIFDVRKVCF